MRFSIIIPTRNRPDLFADALTSVLAQRFTDIEIVVVNDGSDPSQFEAYRPALDAARARLDTRLHVFTLLHRPNGHGQSYSLNYGVAQAQGDYVTFLDDDDTWTDPDHLVRADRVLTAAADADLYMANQRAYRFGAVIDEGLWIAPLAPRLRIEGRMPDADGCYRVAIADLLRTPGFCHVNALIVRRSLYQQVGGMDETIRWECDRDLFLRLIEAAGLMLHHPAEMSRHNIPDPQQSSNMTTALSSLQRHLSQLRVVDKASTMAAHPLIRAHGRQHRAYVLAKIAKNLADAGDERGAAAYARAAFASRPSPSGLADALGRTITALTGISKT